MIMGNISGWINSTEQIIFDTEVTGSAVSSISTGNILNGDEDGWYTIISRYIAGANGSYVQMRFNNDGGTNYGTRGIAANSTTVSNSSSTGDTGAIAGYCATSGHTSFLVARMYAKSGAVRLINYAWCLGISDTTCTELRTFGCVWNNTSDNITNINFVGSGTNIGVGTRIIILKSNNFTNGTPTGSITTPYIKGAWVRVGSQVLGAAASSVTFSGLDGDRDVVYYLSKQMKGVTTLGAFPIRLNSDSGTNYGYQRLQATSTSIYASRDTNTSLAGFTSNIDNANYTQSSMILFAKKGFVRPALHFSNENISGTTVASICTNGTVWNNAADNITTLVVSKSAGSFDTGSQFELYALRPQG